MSKTLKRAKSTDVLDRRVFAPGAVIFQEGDPGTGAYIIQSGFVEIYRQDGLKEQFLGILEKGAMFGEMALIDRSPRMATARAAIQTTVIEVKASTFRKKIAEADPFIGGLLRILVGNLRSVTERVTPI